VAECSKDGDDKQAKEIIEASVLALARGDRELQNDQIVNLIRTHLKSDPPHTAILFATRFHHLNRLPEQLDLLFHDDYDVRTTAQQALVTQPQMVAKPEVYRRLVALLEDSTRADDHRRAVELLGQSAVFFLNGPVAPMKQQVVDELSKIVMEGDASLVPAAIKSLVQLDAEDERSVLNGFIEKEDELPEERRKLLEQMLIDQGGSGMF
jgi:hypothetical protein